MIKKRYRPDHRVSNSPRPFEAELSNAVLHLSGSPFSVKVVDTPMRMPLIFKSIRTADGITVSIDLEKLEPKWHDSFKDQVPPVLALLCSSDCTARQTVVVFADHCLSDEVSICFCAKAGSNHILIPDYDFLRSRGFAKLRHWAQASPVPWETRVDEILWRGVTTGYTQDAENLINQLPRVKMCLLAKNIPRTSFKIVELVQSSSPETDQKFLDEAGIMAEKRLPVEGWTGHKIAIDIDGNTNSFNTMLHRLTLGCCVLKVKSQENWCQWFYGEISPWIDFVPVKSNLSDRAEIIAWCRDHDDECRKIAERGRMFANGLDFHSECKSAVKRINSAFAG